MSTSFSAGALRHTKELVIAHEANLNEENFHRGGNFRWIFKRCEDEINVKRICLPVPLVVLRFKARMWLECSLLGLPLVAEIFSVTSRARWSHEYFTTFNFEPFSASKPAHRHPHFRFPFRFLCEHHGTSSSSFPKDATDNGINRNWMREELWISIYFLWRRYCASSFNDLPRVTARECFCSVDWFVLMFFPPASKGG